MPNARTAGRHGWLFDGTSGRERGENFVYELELALGAGRQIVGLMTITPIRFTKIDNELGLTSAGYEKIASPKTAAVGIGDQT